MRYALLACLLACEAAPPTDSTSLAIIQGAYDPDDPGVAAVLEENGAIACTGTLVAPRALVSAGHCAVLSAPRYVFFGPDPGGDGMFVNVLATHVHPEFDLGTLDADVGVIVLDELAPTFAGQPVGLATTPPLAGAEVRMVGYGYTEVGPAGDYGTKHVLTVPVDEVMERAFRYGVATCNGDSGGPALIDEGGREVIAGVTSYGDESCAEYGVDTRLDVFRGWVLEVIAGIGGPSCEPDDGCLTSCTPRDVDCPVTPSGERCLGDFDCGDQGLCVDHVCRHRCDATTGGAEACGAGERCEPVESLVTAGLAACIPEEGCGCRAGGPARPGPSAAWLPPLAGLLLLLRRRRGARRIG